MYGIKFLKNICACIFKKKKKNKDPKNLERQVGDKYLRMYRIKFSKKFVHVWDKNFEKNKDPKI